MTIKFCGAAREVTGSKHLITLDDGMRILLDCGMYQGKGMETDAMNRNLGFDPASIDVLLLSHAHIDHSGLIPYLYKGGFRGTIYCTSATRDLCALMLEDSAFIQELDVKWYNKKMAKQHKPFVQPIYTTNDAIDCMQLFVGVPYNHYIRINDKVSVLFTGTCHMLGGAAIHLDIEEGGEKKRITFTGDVGRKHSRILPPPVAFPESDYIITESTYGDTLHDPEAQIASTLLDVLEYTCVKKQGKLIIPSFSVGRTQEIVYEFNQFYNSHLLPHIDVYVDSPLAVNATEIFKMHTETMNEDVRHTLMYDSDPFGFNSLRYVANVAESKALNTTRKPCIIISASGMAEAGRVKHHIANSIDNQRNTILFVGYCAPTTLGARLQKPGIEEISIFGEMHRVEADIRSIEAFSGHADYKELLDYLSCQDKKVLKGVFVVHGEAKTAQRFAGHLREVGFHHIRVPQQFEVVTL